MLFYIKKNEEDEEEEEEEEEEKKKTIHRNLSADWIADGLVFGWKEKKEKLRHIRNQKSLFWCQWTVKKMCLCVVCSVVC